MLADVGPPAAFAVPEGGRTALVAEVGLLTLPDPSEPATIYRGPEGWCLEHASDVREVHDGDVVRVGDVAWRLALPEALPPTAEADEAPPRISDLRLRFAVGHDREYVELIVFHGASVLDFKARSCHYPQPRRCAGAIDLLRQPEPDTVHRRCSWPQDTWVV